MSTDPTLLQRFMALGTGMRVLVLLIGLLTLFVLTRLARPLLGLVLNPGVVDSLTRDWRVWFGLAAFVLFFVGPLFILPAIGNQAFKKTLLEAFQALAARPGWTAELDRDVEGEPAPVARGLYEGRPVTVTTVVQWKLVYFRKRLKVTSEIAMTLRNPAAWSFVLTQNTAVRERKREDWVALGEPRFDAAVLASTDDLLALKRLLEPAVQTALIERFKLGTRLNHRIRLKGNTLVWQEFIPLHHHRTADANVSSLLSALDLMSTLAGGIEAGAGAATPASSTSP